MSIEQAAKLALLMCVTHPILQIRLTSALNTALSEVMPFIDEN
jgi:hypothetical protein